MPRRGENIYKRKDGRWEGRYIKEYDISNKAHYGYVYGKTYNEVKSKLKNTCIENAMYCESLHVETYDVMAITLQFSMWYPPFIEIYSSLFPDGYVTVRYLSSTPHAQGIHQTLVCETSPWESHPRRVLRRLRREVSLTLVGLFAP